MPIIQATSGFRGQEDRASMGKSFSRLYLENTQKGLVKRLKVYVLSSNSSTTKQKKEKKLHTLSGPINSFMNCLMFIPE
jgi:FMN-dependent NADH-azoreductase